MEGSEFLKGKYPTLHTSPEVDAAAIRTEAQTKKEISEDPTDLIQNYLDRLEHVALDPLGEQIKTSALTNQPAWLQGETRPRAIGLLREMLMNKYVRPNKEKMAQGAARVEERAAREMGIAAEYGEQELTERGDIAVRDLERSLDNWILYLSDRNEPYPTWFRYYAFRNILNLADFDKDKGEFTERSRGSVKLFPDIDRGALSYVEQMIEASKDIRILERLRNAQAEMETPDDQIITLEKAQKFAKLSFSKQYTEGIKQAGEITPEMREETRGAWVKYCKGTDPTALWASLQNKGTAWCTKGFATAETHLKGGDFYVYYTLDKQGQPSIPRIAIRMQDDRIGEVRGVADNQQNLEGNMADIAEAKMNELPGVEKYRKVSGDMKRLTEIEKKSKERQAMSQADLAFLYETNEKIEGFGYQKDPRINEIKKDRNKKSDYALIYAISDTQVAETMGEINDETSVYVGEGEYKGLDENSSFEQIETISRIKGLKTDLTTIKPEYKAKITEWEGSITDETKGNVRYSALESVGGDLDARYVTSFEAKTLQSVGRNLDAGSATSFEFNTLVSVGGYLNAPSATLFEANALQSVGRNLDTQSATSFEAKALVSVGGFLSAGRSSSFEAKALVSVGGFFDARCATLFEANALQSVGGDLYALNATTFEANDLQSVERILYAVEATTFKVKVLSRVKDIYLSSTIKEEDIDLPSETRNRIKRVK